VCGGVCVCVVCGWWCVVVGGGYAVEVEVVRVSDTPLTDYFFALPPPITPM
jgi:hypothetical protein